MPDLSQESWSQQRQTATPCTALRACVNTALGGRLNLDPEPAITTVTPPVIRCDADLGFSTRAFEQAQHLLVENATAHGLAALVINRCFHFSPLWPEVEAIAERGLAALAMTPSHSWVAPWGENRPVFGTNPIAFAWPRGTEHPFVFDFATSALARVDFEACARRGTALPDGCAVDPRGAPTTNPELALAGAMLPFGEHKGSALAAMVELLAGALIGDLTSAESMRFDAGRAEIPMHGELILAFNPRVFGGDRAASGRRSAEALFSAIRDQGARLPSQRRFRTRENTFHTGKILVAAETLADIDALLDELTKRK